MSRVFYVYEGAQTSYEQFARQVRRRARAFSAHRGEVVAMWADNDPDFVVNLFALWAAGAVPFLVSRRLPSSTVSVLMKLAQARALVTADAHRCDAASLPLIAATGSPDETDADAEPAEPPAIGPEAQAVAVILHTSGTTNLPKLVPITRAGLHASLRFEELSWRGSWTERDATAGWLPLYHAFGLVSELLHAYRTGSRYYFAEPNPRALLALLQQAPITLLSSVPWMLQQLLELPQGAAALARLRWVVVSGAVLSAQLGGRLRSAGVRVLQQHGMTELGAVFRGSPDGDWQDMLPVIPESFWHLEESSGQLIVHGDCPTLSAQPPGQEFPTRDTFRRTPAGPTVPGQLGDVLVHVNGEKSDEVTIERWSGAAP
jgi:acyl-CoA synthetase (AMP-forming)/AMP-acid ligase II